MRKLNRFLTVILILVILLSWSISVQVAAEELPAGNEYYDLGKRIEEFVSEHEDTTAGMGISVFHRDDTVYTGYFGYADRDAGIAVDQDTVIEWGSATKILVWVSVMQLWERGEINLDADIRDYLPAEFLTNLKYDTPVTMTNLMNHNAGFQETYSDMFVKEQDAIRTLDDALQAHEPAQIYEPGTVTAYSNWGTALAAYIVERIGGESFDDYVHQNIFEPLGMEHSALSADLSDNAWVREKRKELQCYTVDGTLIPDCFYYIPLYPTGMCTSTLNDFESFGKALLNENSPLFQKKETWKVLFTPTAYLGDSDIPSNYHGLWVIPYGTEVIGHGGNSAGCSSYMLMDIQNGIGVAVMTNQSNETVYNFEMPKLIFGEFSAQKRFDSERSMSGGLYRNARVVRVGPFKLTSIFYTFDGVDPDEFCMPGTDGGVEKLCFSYGDGVCISTLLFIVEMALCLLWIAVVLFSVISLLVKLIRKIVCVCRKEQTAMPQGKWSTLSAVVQVLTVVLVLVMVIQAKTYATASSYVWIPAILGVIAIIMIGLAVYGMVTIRKTENTKKRKFFNWATSVMLLITPLNIIYWNLFMWWQL